MTMGGGSALELLVEARDQATSVINGVGKAGAGVARTLANNWKETAAAGIAAGAGLELLARGQQENTQATERLAVTTGMSSGAIRDLARDLATVDTPLSDVFALMEAGTKQGVEGAEALKAYAGFWDNVGDASGLSAEQLTAATVGLRNVGVETDNLASANAALGYVQTSTTAGLEGFFGLLAKRGPDLQAMNINVDQAAALLGVLESHGLSGKVALSEFGKAVDGANGSQEEMLKLLGVAPEEFEAHQLAVAGSATKLDELAAANNSTFTPMQKLKALIDEHVFAHGELLGKLVAVAPALTAIGPLMTLASSATGIWTAAQWLFNAAMTANPIGLVIVAIGALVAAGVLLYKHWDDVKAAAIDLWHGLESAFDNLRAAVLRALDPVMRKINDLNDLARRARDLVASVPGVGAAAKFFNVPGFANGTGPLGVPGPRGMPRLILAHGGEVVTPPGRGGAGGGTTIINVYTGVGDPVEIGRTVAEYVNAASKAGGAVLLAGAVQ